MGMGMLAVAGLPPMMMWAHHDILGHMAQHLLIGMFAPVFLVRGVPLTLLLKSLSAAKARYVVGILRNDAVGAISHPIAALLLNIGGMYLLYLTPLYALSLSNTFVHHFVHVHFFMAGYLFCWSIAGQEVIGKRPSVPLRAWVLFVGIAAHAFLGKYMYANILPDGTPFSGTAIREAAKAMYYWGDLAELILAAFFFWDIALGSYTVQKQRVLNAMMLLR